MHFKSFITFCLGRDERATPEGIDQHPLAKESLEKKEDTLERIETGSKDL
jgi:hypothetical protein